MGQRARADTDYYRILGLHPEATEEQLRKAYRRLALQWHPDRNPGQPAAEERFKEISEAYAVLSDPAKRHDYDRARRAGAAYEPRGSREDLFRDLFADPRASAVFEELAREFERLGMRVDRHYFRQTLFGGRAVVTGGVFIISPLTPVLAIFKIALGALRAAGVLPRARQPALPKPGGLHRAFAGTARWLLGLPPSPAPSQHAATGGDLTIPLRLSRAEAEAGGRKRVAFLRHGVREEALVTIPPGVRPGTRLRLRGKGGADAGRPPGDLYLAIEIADEG
ncbi:MAG TPA: DnaJ domain-containing protein [Methylomirabilota bacterium]|nr:DnaJ domain-containing protein [Methylomirabilota bacterium]